jgi:hypothetical protein
MLVVIKPRLWAVATRTGAMANLKPSTLPRKKRANRSTGTSPGHRKRPSMRVRRQKSRDVVHVREAAQAIELLASEKLTHRLIPINIPLLNAEIHKVPCLLNIYGLLYVLKFLFTILANSFRDSRAKYARRPSPDSAYSSHRGRYESPRDRYYDNDAPRGGYYSASYERLDPDSDRYRRADYNRHPSLSPPPHEYDNRRNRRD